jgi:ArsR family transcriptional regulator, arsenate/arsenite/antimonite-responsive transcriptional repressor
MKTTDALASLAALAQDSRLAVFRTLVQAAPEGLPAGDVAAKVGIVPATLSFHLKELANARLVKSRQQGRFVIYTASLDTINALVGYLTENCCGRGAACEVACAPSPRPKSSKEKTK